MTPEKLAEFKQWLADRRDTCFGHAVVAHDAEKDAPFSAEVLLWRARATAYSEAFNKLEDMVNSQ